MSMGGCGLPEISAVLNAPSISESIAPPDSFTISGNVSNSADISFYGIEIYYKIYAADSISDAKNLFDADQEAIENANTATSINPTSTLTSRSFKRAYRDSNSSADVLDTQLQPGTSPLVPINLTAGSPWSITLRAPGSTAANTDGMLLESDIFNSGTNLVLWRKPSNTNNDLKKFQVSAIDTGADNDISGSGANYYLALALFAYGIDTSSSFAIVYSPAKIVQSSEILLTLEN